MRQLREWKAMNPSANNTPASNSRNYKNRFTKLLRYAEAHKPPMAVKTLITNITNNSFHYTMHYKKDNSEWETDLLVATSKFTDDWAIQFHRDYKFLNGEQGKGYEDLLKALSFYIDIPPVGSPEYNNLLVESTKLVDEFKEYETLWD